MSTIVPAATAALIVFGSWAAAASGVNPPATMEAAEMTAADVRRVAAKETAFAEACRIVRQAGPSGARELIEPLKSVVTVWSRDPQHALVAYYALHRLWQLGAPREYFIGNLERYRDNKWLAYYSILTLGRDPDADLMKRLRRIEADMAGSPDNDLHAAIAAVRQARDVIETYEGIADAEQRIDLVLRYAGSTWNPISGMRSDPIDQYSPLPFWARKELGNLTTEHGPLVAERLIKLDVGGDYGMTNEARDYIAQFLPSEVQRAYERLKQ